MSDGGWKAGEIADILREGDFNADIDAVLSDEKLAGDVLLRLDREDLEDGPLASLLAAQTSTDMLRRARVQSDVTSMSAATGLSDSRSEATGYQRLINAFKPAAQQVVIRGGKGTGKTGTILELLRWLVREGVVDKVLSNVPVRGMSIQDLERADETGEIPQWWFNDDENDKLGTLAPQIRFAEDISDFLDFAKEPGEKLALFDEFSTVGNAYSNQQDVQQIMGSAINAFRKSMRGSLRTVYIGHQNDKDIHPLVRKQSDVVISKDGKASEGLADLASVYESWSDYIKNDTLFKVRGIKDVPEGSPWRYDTNYFAHLEWNLDNPSVQIQRGKLVDNWEDLQGDLDDDDDDADDAEADEQYRSCRGSKVNGDECGATVTHKSGYCHAHRAQWDGNPDPRLSD